MEGSRNQNISTWSLITLNNAIRNVITTDICTSVPALPSGSQIIFQKTSTDEGSQIENL